MNYQAVYERLVARARTRTLTSYTERHHIVPRCLGGTDDPANIVRLTPEEHYVAHQLLVKMYQDEPKLLHAAVLMAGGRSGNKVYGWLKRRLAQARSIPHSVQHRANLSVSRRLRPPPTQATRSKTSVSLRGRVRSIEHCASISVAKRGRLSPTARASSIENLRLARERLAEKRRTGA